MEHADHRQILQQITYRVDAEFRGVQEEALRAIVQRRSPVVAVMGTSVGKSVLFMLLAAASRPGVTIVVVPLDSLRSNMVDRCRATSIRCKVWVAERPADRTQIIIVTPKGVVQKAFQDFVNRQQTLSLLDRIVIDECHVMLESVNNWWPKMLALIELS